MVSRNKVRLLQIRGETKIKKKLRFLVLFLILILFLLFIINISKKKDCQNMQDTNAENKQVNTLIDNALIHQELFSKDFLSKILTLDLNNENSVVPKNEKFRIVLFCYNGWLGDMQTIIELAEELKEQDFEVAFLNEASFFLFPRLNADLFLTGMMEAPPPEVSTCRSICILNYPNESASLGGLYDGYLTVCDLENFKNLNKKIGDRKKIITEDFKVTCKYRPFKNNKKEKLFYCGNMEDEKRGKILLPLWKKLDLTGYTEFYGNKTYFKNNEIKSFKYKIPHDCNTLYEIMEECGIALVVHSDCHFLSNTTTSRIFEAAASSCLIICDELPFVKENFGDSVLYIDRSKSQEEIFEEIDSHVKWAQKNPEEVIKKAKESNEIFKENFALEKEILKIKKLYDRIID